MTDRPPPSLGSYRPNAAPAPQVRPETDASLPRIITSRIRPDVSQPPARSLPPARAAETDYRDEPSGWRWLKYLVFGLSALIATAVVAAYVLVPTRLIADRLQAEVKARSGSDLVIAGRSTLSLWPRPTVVVRDVTLSGPTRTGGAPLFKAAEIEIAVQILPLLLHDVAVDRLALRHVVVDLTVDASGRRNWDFTAAEPTTRLAEVGSPSPGDLPRELRDFMRGATGPAGSPGAAGRTAVDASAAETRGASPSTARHRSFNDLTLGRVDIIDGSVHFRDARNGADETVTAIEAQLSLPNMASPMIASGDLTWHGEAVHLKASVSPARDLLEGRAVTTQIAATAAPLAATFDGIMVPSDGRDINGHLTASAPSLARLANWLGHPSGGVSATALQFDGRLKQSATGFAVDDARLTLGGLAGRGALSVETRANTRPLVRGTLYASVLDFDAIRLAAQNREMAGVSSALSKDAVPAAPKSIEDLITASPGVAAPPPRAASSAAASAGGAGRDWSDEVIDLSPLALADADVRLTFDSIVWRDLATGPGQIALSVKDRAARFALDGLQLYEGNARGIVTLDGTGADAIVGANLVADGVAALPFLKAVGGFDWLSGRAHAAVAIAGRGLSQRQFVATLTGKADLAITNGALQGLNIATIVRNLGQGKGAVFERSPNEKTDFSAFSASAQITGGIARNDDLRITSADIRATGAGTIDLPARTMDYLLKPAVTAAAGLEVPLKITGSIDRPTVAPQLAGLLRDPKSAMQAIEAAAATPAGKDIQNTVKGLLNGDPAARAKAKSFLDQLLKN